MLCTICKQRTAIYDVAEFAIHPSESLVCDECLDVAVESRESCPTCGWKEEDYRLTGLMGCADCYLSFLPLTFREALRLQEKTEHVGKKPQDMDFNLLDERALLEKKIERYMREERSEEEIKRLGERLRAVIEKIEGDADGTH
ncbi:MAG: hypothetical protein J5993_02485 [Clostridia bacterium]|nr:hypothetical protein [Clostridia bacterium]